MRKEEKGQYLLVLDGSRGVPLYYAQGESGSVWLADREDAEKFGAWTIAHAKRRRFPAGIRRGTRIVGPV